MFPQLGGNPDHRGGLEGTEKPQQWNKGTMEEDRLLAGLLTFLVTAGSR